MNRVLNITTGSKTRESYISWLKEIIYCTKNNYIPGTRERNCFGRTREYIYISRTSECKITIFQEFQEGGIITISSKQEKKLYKKKESNNYVRTAREKNYIPRILKKFVFGINIFISL
jgi:hypothetical protein